MQFRFDQADIRVTHADQTALLADVVHRLALGQGFALATVNLDHLVKLRQDAAFRHAYIAQDMVVADGNPIVWLSRLAGKPVGLVPGSDLVLPLVRSAVAARRPVALVGATAPVLERAATHMARVVPGADVRLCIAPPMGFDPAGPGAHDILGQVAEIGPCLCLLALGAPRQERLAALGRKLAPEAGFASIGAGVDFIAGSQVRAPEWVRELALEWAWRMMSSPRRLGPRYVACAAILPGQMIEALRQRAGR